MQNHIFISDTGDNIEFVEWNNYSMQTGIYEGATFELDGMQKYWILITLCPNYLPTFWFI